MLATWGTSTGFNPSSLFAGGVQGAWYDPSDNTTMFQDAAGTTAVTAVEQAVGLILDKSVPTQTTGYYSGAFDGTGDLLTVPDDVAFTLGSGDFTIEFWSYTTKSGRQAIVYQINNSGSNTSLSFYVEINAANKIEAGVAQSSTAYSATSTGSVSQNVWTHVAFVRNGNTGTIYINGSADGTVNLTGVTVNDSAETVRIGDYSTTGAIPFRGFLSNLRIVKGTAVYTGNFTPSTTPLTAISGTSLLTLQNNRFIDNSSNAFTLTVNGNPGTNLLNPFNATAVRMVNNAYQTTSASRPTLRARYNLLTRSEEFNDAAWTKQNTTVTANATTAPDGTLTADKVIPNTTLGAHAIRQDVTTLAQPYVFSIYAKASEYIWLILANTTAAQSRTFNLQTGVVGTSSSGTSTATITDVGNGWYRCTITGTATAASNAFRAYVTTTDDVNSNFSGDDVSGMFMWGAQVVPTAAFPSNTYQRIAAATDYATGAAFPQYLAFDGTDDSLLTANVDFATVTSDGAARRNLLVNPTQFDAAGWTRQTLTVTANATTAPDGSLTADKLIPSATPATQQISQLSVVSSQTCTMSIYAKADGINTFEILDGTGGSNGGAFDLLNVTASNKGTGQASIVAVGDGWYRCIAVATTTGFRLYCPNSSGSASGDGTSGIFIWGAQLETGSTATDFQNIGTDKMTVFSGLSKLSDAAVAVVAELGNRSLTQAGSFSVLAPNNAATTNYGSTVEGSTVLTYRPSPFASPITNVLAIQFDIDASTAAAENIPRVNTVVRQDGITGTSAGTGNFGTYPLYIGRRGGTSLPFNGRIYSLIVRGAASNSSQITQTERYVAAKTPLGVVP